jgi:hypothetical protein
LSGSAKLKTLSKSSRQREKCFSQFSTPGTPTAGRPDIESVMASISPSATQMKGEGFFRSRTLKRFVCAPSALRYLGHPSVLQSCARRHRNRRFTGPAGVRYGMASRPRYVSWPVIGVRTTPRRNEAAASGPIPRFSRYAWALVSP